MNRPQGRWLRFVYKRIVAGDIRKFSAESADAGTGGGARDLRFNPAEKFWPVFERMFSAVATKKCLDARLIWDGEITNTEVYPPTSARPNEARITRVNACCPTKLIPSDDEEFIFILIQGEDGVHASFMTKQQVLDNRFTLGLESVLIRAIEYSETTKVPVGFVDLENHVQYSSIGDVMNMVMFHPYLVREDILAAIRTKPFILLAGISGTGKSRMVRQLARGCCPRYTTGTTDDHPFYDKQKPGNFEIIPVRPNWHDSTELMGYESRIGTPEFIIKPFVEFLVKAWMNPDIPFFLCLDEMNLAPVEQYFAEYLSAIESRKALNGGGRDYFKTDVVVKIGLPEKQWDDAGTSVLHNALAKLFEPYKTAGTLDAWATYVRDLFTKDGGVSIPQNLVVMGTVNMDETTCSFSRKVLDRAMSFELNDVSDMYAPDKLVGEGDYEFGSIDVAAAKCSLLTGKEAYDSNAAVGGKVLEYLKIVNEALEGKKFKIAYRSRNEIMIYCVERTNGGIVGLRQALDEATSLKILSRIEGDDQTFASFDLKGFRKTIVKGLLAIDNPSVQDSDVEDFLKDEAKVKASPCASKLGHMIDELSHGAGVVSYWE